MVSHLCYLIDFSRPIDDFPIVGPTHLKGGGTQTRKREKNEIPSLRDLERLPRDEVIRRRLLSDVSPILSRLVEVEPLVLAQSERETETKNRLLQHNDKVRQESVDQRRLEAQRVNAYLRKTMSS